MRPNRVLLGVTAAAAFCVCGFFAYLGTLLTFFNACWGDGGDPYSAPDSPAGRFCESPVSGPFVLAQFFLPILLVAVLGTMAVAQRSWNPLWLAVLSSGAVLLGMYTFVALLPTD